MKTFNQFVEEHTDICPECLSDPCNCDDSHVFVKEDADAHYAEAEAHKNKASKALETSDMAAHHFHMSNHHESMGRWHEDKGRHSSADREYAKAEEHHEKSMKPNHTKTVKEEVLDVASTYKKIAVKHLKDMMSKDSTEANKRYAKTMHGRALEASKMNNHTDALNHYRGVKEESINELSSDLLQRYKDKARKSADELTSQGKHGKSLNRTMSRMKATGKQIEKTTASIKKALNKEEASSADDHIKAFASQAHEEWRKGFDPSGSGKERIKKNSDGTHGNINVPFHKLHPDWQHENLAAGAAAHHAVTHHGDNMEAAADHVHKEWMKRNPKAEWNADQHKPYSELPEHEKEKDRVHVRTMAAIMNKKINESINVEQYDKGEYDYEGQMARTQLQTTMRNCKDLIDMIEDDENMPEWVQSKITLAQDYITTVRDYMQSKEELGEETLFESKHKVAVTVSEKDHPMVSKRLEKQQKRVVVSANSKDEAVSRAKKFYTKQGYHVHDAEYHSSMSEGVKSPGIGWMIKKDPHLKAVIAKHKEKMKNFKAYVGTKIEPKDKK